MQEVNETLVETQLNESMDDDPQVAGDAPQMLVVTVLEPKSLEGPIIQVQASSSVVEVTLELPYHFF